MSKSFKDEHQLGTYHTICCLLPMSARNGGEDNFIVELHCHFFKVSTTEGILTPDMESYSSDVLKIPGSYRLIDLLPIEWNSIESCSAVVFCC
jgi:hypothetical protein